MDTLGPIIALVLSGVSMLIASMTWALTRKDRLEETRSQLGYRKADRLAREEKDREERLSIEKRELKEDLRRIEQKIDDAIERLSRLEGGKV